MRQLGTLGDQQQARRLADYLLTLGITTQVEPAESGAVVWVRDEDQLARARQEFEKFRAAPDDPRYQVGHEADRIRSEAESYARRFQKNQIDVRRRWASGMSSRRGPLTIALIGISIAITILSNFGKLKSGVTLFCLISNVVFVESAPWNIQLPEIQHGQLWRLVTPIFLHFGAIHLIFNMLMIVQLGSLVEARRGAIRYAALVLAIAVLSNLAQYAATGPVFGGMSGVNYGLFGYIWMKSRYDPGSGMFLSQNVVFWMLAWLVLCFTGLVGNVANMAHLVGLAVGVVIGIAPRLWGR